MSHTLCDGWQARAAEVDRPPNLRSPKTHQAHDGAAMCGLPGEQARSCCVARKASTRKWSSYVWRARHAQQQQAEQRSDGLVLGRVGLGAPLQHVRSRCVTQPKQLHRGRGTSANTTHVSEWSTLLRFHPLYTQESGEGCLHERGWRRRQVVHSY